MSQLNKYSRVFSSINKSIAEKQDDDFVKLMEFCGEKSLNRLNKSIIEEIPINIQKNLINKPKITKNNIIPKNIKNDNIIKNDNPLSTYKYLQNKKIDNISDNNNKLAEYDSLTIRLKLAEAQCEALNKITKEKYQNESRKYVKSISNIQKLFNYNNIENNSIFLKMQDNTKGTGSYIFKHTKTWHIARINADRYKRRFSEQKRVQISESILLKKNNNKKNILRARILDVDSQKITDIHSMLMYTMVRFLPSEQCMKIIGRIAKYRDNQKHISYQRLLGDCVGGSRRIHHNNKRPCMKALAEGGPEILALLARCYQTISIAYMIVYVKNYGSFSRSFITETLAKYEKPRLFDFVRYPHRQGLREIPGFITRPWSLESYVKLLPRCSANTFLYTQLKLRKLISDPNNINSSWAQIKLSSESGMIIEPNRQLLFEKKNQTKLLENIIENKQSINIIDGTTQSLQTIKVAHNIPQLIKANNKNSEKKTNQENAILDPSDIHPKTYRSFDQRGFNKEDKDSLSSIWWALPWKGGRKSFFFKRKKYSLKNKDHNTNSLDFQQTGWQEVKHINDQQQTFYAPKRKRKRRR